MWFIQLFILIGSIFFNLISFGSIMQGYTEHQQIATQQQRDSDVMRLINTGWMK